MSNEHSESMKVSPTKQAQFERRACLQQLGAIAKDINDREAADPASLVFEDYAEAGRAYARTKQPLIRQLMARPVVRFQDLKDAYHSTNMYPVDDDILECELRLLEHLSTHAPSSPSSEMKAWLKSITTEQIPLLHFNRASWYSRELTERINARIERHRMQDLSDAEGDSESESVDQDAILSQSFSWREIFRWIKDSISKFERARDAYAEVNDQANVNVCSRAMSCGHEKLGDYHFDRARERQGHHKRHDLERALHYFEKAHAVPPRDTALVDIHLSIMHCYYELAAWYREHDDVRQQVEYLHKIRAQLATTVRYADHYKSRPEVVFYELDTLWQLFSSTQTTETDKKMYEAQAMKLMDEFAERCTSATYVDILDYLTDYSRRFGLTSASAQELNAEFQMAPCTDPQWPDKRWTQFRDGIAHLVNDNQSKTQFNIELKSHQLAALRALLAFQDRAGYFCLPTAAGKTYVMLLATLATRLPTLIIVPSTLLMEQTIEVIGRLAPDIRVSRYDGLAKHRFGKQILVTTYQSLVLDHRLAHPRIPLEQFGLVWADEAHRSITHTRATVIETLRRTAFVFGLTATESYNTERKEGDFTHVNEVFGNKVYEVPLLALIEAKQLAPVKNVLVHVDALGIKRPKRARRTKKIIEYSDAELEEHLNQDKFNRIVCDLYLNEYDPYTGQPIFGQSTLVFCAGILHAEAVCRMLNQMGNDKWQNGHAAGTEHSLAACIHSAIAPRRRKQLMEAHKRGDIPVLLGDSIFVEGYDNPQDSVGLFLRPTQSSVMAKQSRGRLLRPAALKSCALIIEWVYPNLSQCFFYDFIERKRWAGIEPSDCSASVPQVKTQRVTDKYRVDWGSQAPVYVDLAPPRPLKVQRTASPPPRPPAPVLNPIRPVLATIRPVLATIIPLPADPLTTLPFLPSEWPEALDATTWRPRSVEEEERVEDWTWD